MLTIHLHSQSGNQMIDLSDTVRSYVRASHIERGLCHIFVPHTTAAITLNSAADAGTAQDILDELCKLVPTRVDFKHQFDTPSDAAGHIKSSLIGNSVSVPVRDGELVSGNYSILFCEFDGPRQRRVLVTLINTGSLAPDSEIRL